ncbi:hypothetical protein [Pseudarthrobacter sp. L1SW]|uniref:RHS repeat domain-containing protein n=1 Tax=Pseudarthrobacter sp. L1SW TaxID=2851598 RepID=UPI00351D27DE|nr:hypothetical protein KTR40_08445 [Pseudarthrobacter sp. L1SW]
MHNRARLCPPRQASDAVVIGESLTDIVTTLWGTNEHPGGSPGYVAFGLARLGVSTRLLTSLAKTASQQEPGQSRLTYTRRNQVATVNDPQNAVTSYKYDAAGRQTKADLPGTDRHDLYL